MSLVFSVVLTLIVQQPIYIPGCCPILNVAAVRIVPVLVIPPSVELKRV